MTPANILIVEDEQLVALSIQRKLESFGYNVLGTMATGETAIEFAKNIRPDLILMDITLAGQMDGITAASFLREQFNIPIIYLTAYSDGDTLKRAKRTEPFGYLLKPFEGKELQAAIEIALYKRQMEQQLQEKELWLSTILNSIGDAVIATDREGDVTFMNPVAERLTGWSQTEATGLPLATVFCLIDETSQKPMTHLAAQVLNSRRVVNLNHRPLLNPRYGEKRPIQGSVAPIFRDTGNVWGVVLVFHDVSEIEQTRQALRTSEEKYRLLFENSPESIVLLGLDGTIIDCNKATERLRGRPKEQIIGQSFMEVAPLKTEDLPHFVNLFSQMLQGEEIDPIVIELDGKVNDLHWVEVFTNVLYQDGQMDAIQIITRDITQRKATEQEMARYQEGLEQLVAARTAALASANLQLAQSNSELEQFAYVASHDLREPLRKVKSYAELLAQRYQDKLDARADKYIHYIVDGSTRMQQLITELLVYSRLGRAELSWERVALTAVLQKTLSDLELVIRETQATITWDPLPTVLIDTQQISRLLQNLLDNALKFRGEKPPKVHLGVQQSDSEWLFSLSDNGIGIEPQYIERVFLIFQRLHTRSDYPGTGIGLAICKKIVESHNGRIWATSTPGQGATFHFTLPKL